MKSYPKIKTVFKREKKKPFKVIEGDWSLSEFEYLRCAEWEFTEKINGTNIRVMFNGIDLKFGGRTDNAQIPKFLLEKLTEKFKTTQFVDVFGFGGVKVCLYGEGYGAKIQKGGGNYISDGVDFILFDVLIDDWWLERENIEDIAEKLGIDVVPIVNYGPLDKAIRLVKNGLESRWGNFEAEGLVMKPKVGLRTKRGDRIITKIKRKDF